MPRKTNDHLSRFTVEVPLKLRERLDQAAEREDRTITVIVRRAIEEYVAKSENTSHE